MASDPIDFWFTMGSTYTYLSVMRLPAVERAHAVAFRWRPYNLRLVLARMNHVPFADKPAKLAYMWRDIERRAALHGIAARVPAPYPAPDSNLANQVALLGLTEGWGEAFVRAAYRRWFQDGQATGGEPNLSQSLREAGQDPAPVIARARDAAAEQQLLDETETAQALGLFGSPTFVVGRELFWGDDRLEDAVSWHKYGRVRALET